MELRPRPWRMMQNTSRCRRVIGRRAARERPPKSNWHANAQCCSHASARRQVSALDQPRKHSKTVGEVFGPPIGASEAASGSSTLPEVRWSDVSGPPASRSYTQGVDEQPSIEVKQLQPGSLLKGTRTSHFSRKSPQFVPVPFGLCTITRIEAHRIQVEQLGCKDRGYICTRQR